MKNIITVVGIYRYHDNKKLKALVDIRIGDFIIKGLTVLKDKKFYVAYPQEKNKEGEYYHTFFPCTEEARQQLSNIILTAYKERIKCLELE